MASSALFPQLTPDDHPWRIDWFGEVAYPGAIKRYRQPCIRVAISRLHSEDIPFTPEQTDVKGQRQVWMQIGSLTSLRVGDIWQNGRLHSSPDYELISLPDLAINKDTSTFVKAGIEVDGTFLLPFRNHPWHQEHTNSYCQLIRIDTTRQLLIPCAEIIRFYFGSTSGLLHALFTQPFEEERLWEAKHFEPATGHLHIKLASNIWGASAADVGRIALSSYAQSAAARIYTSCLKATSIGEQAYPRIALPFVGRTTFTASGIWLPAEANHLATFVVFSLRSCSHPFPFRSLTYETKERIRKGSSNSRKSTSNSASGDLSKAEKDSSVLTDTDPGTAKTAKRLTIDSKVRFTDLTKKRVWLEKIKADEAPVVHLKRTGAKLDLMSFGPSEGSSDVRSVDAERQASTATLQDIDLETLPRFVRAGLSSLQKQIAQARNFSLKLAIPQGSESPVFALPMVVDSDGEIEQGVIFESPDGGHRQRQACFIALLVNTRTRHYLAIVEGKQVRSFPEILNLDRADIFSLFEAIELNRN